jgi:hypothetical protein
MRNAWRIDAMGYKETAEKLAAYRRQIADLRKKMRATQASVEPEEVADYTFATPQGPSGCPGFSAARATSS